MANALAGGRLDPELMMAMDHAMLIYVEKLTRHPGGMVEDDVNALREVGFDDAAIGDIATVSAFYAFMNRIVDGLGCSLPRGCDREAQHLGLQHDDHDP